MPVEPMLIVAATRFSVALETGLILAVAEETRSTLLPVGFSCPAFVSSFFDGVNLCKKSLPEVLDSIFKSLWSTIRPRSRSANASKQSTLPV